MKLKKAFISAAVAFAGFSAHADTVIFSDNFNGTPASLNTVPAGWTVSDGTVDVVDSGTYDLTCTGAIGRCVDLDGSTGTPGTLSKSFASVAGTTYNLIFDMSGNQLGYAPDSVTVNFGTASQVINLVSSAPWANYQLSFSALTSGPFTLSFKNGGGDNVGAMLDNVTVTAVPEPESFALMLVGLGMMGSILRRRTANRS
jgi:hypothetical protein